MKATQVILCLLLSCGLGASEEKPLEGSWMIRPGPWGELEVRTVYLTAPDSLLAAVAKPNSVTRWTFEHTTEQSVRALLASIGVQAATLTHLFSSGRSQANGSTVVLHPEVEDLKSLSPEVRSALYTELAKSSANEYQRDPVYVLGGNIEEWLLDAELNVEQRTLFRQLVWRRGEAIVFSDIAALLTLAKNSDEVLKVFRTVTRVRSLIVELKLPLKSDRKQFLEYWSAGQVDAPRLTFINAIISRRAPQTVDITHFLPSLMRQRTYTFPEMELGLKGRFPDCHWTSLNFFNITAKDYFLDTRLAAAHLLENYAAIDAPYHFGDVLCFIDNGEGQHTCVFIAGDIVLTKNGDSILAPWVLMTIADVQSIYRRTSSTRIQGYRLKR